MTVLTLSNSDFLGSCIVVMVVRNICIFCSKNHDILYKWIFLCIEKFAKSQFQKFPEVSWVEMFANPESMTA